MSEYISIQEGNQNKAFNGLNKLETDLQSGGDSCFWVPKSSRQLESISIKANGTYHPQEKYGINRASVSVPGTSDKISGKGQDGNDYTVSLDEDTGELVKTKVPTYIRVTVVPNDTEYEDGDPMNYSGIVVTAYDGEGNTFDTTEYPGGIIPVSELVFPVTVATYEE